MKPAAIPQSESALQRQVVQYLRLRGLLFCHPPNGGRRDPREARAFLGLGVSPGVPDLVIFEEWADPMTAPGHGFGIAIELKSSKGRVSPEQRAWLDALDDRGWLVDVCRTIDEARRVIDCAVRR